MSERRQLVAEVALAVLLVAVVEIAVRRDVRRASPPYLASILPSPVASAKYDAYREWARSGRPVDVLLMGTSAMQDVDTRRLGEGLRTDGAAAPSVFNVSVPGAWVELDRRLLDELVVPLRRPRVIVYGALPLQLLFEVSPAETEKFLDAAPIHGAYTGSPAARLHGALLEHVALLRYHDDIVRRFLRRHVPDDEWEALARTTDATGNVHETGWVTGDWKVKFLWPAELEYQAQLRDFDALMRETGLFHHLAELAASCRAHDIRLVLMSHAVHPRFLELLPHGLRDYRRFVRRIRATAHAAGVTYFAPGEHGIGRRELFRDTHHHNQAGAVWLTDAIATFLAREASGCPSHTPGSVRRTGDVCVTGGILR
jgi:hypothetical protein